MNVASAAEAVATSVAPVHGLTPSPVAFLFTASTPLDYQEGGYQEGERRVPLMISSEQEYYWTRAWQEGELEALEEIKAGEAHVFTDPEAAIRWLLSED
jgi:hypothetical protein